MKNYQIKNFSCDSGERMAVLINRGTGQPLWFENLYATRRFRCKSRSVSTVSALLTSLMHLRDIGDLLDINFEERFEKKEALQGYEIGELVYWINKPRAVVLDALREELDSSDIVKISSLRKGKFEQARHKVISDSKGSSVQSSTVYRSIIYIAPYIKWLAQRFGVPFESVDEMDDMFTSYLPKNIGQEAKRKFAYKSYDKRQLSRIHEVIHPMSKENPWSSEEIRFRNALMMRILEKIGCRRGELLNLKVSNIDLNKRTINIRRSANDPSDSRVNQPRVKTLGRDVAVDIDTWRMIDDYIIKYRSREKDVRSTKFLFVTHDGQGARPLSISSLMKTFRQLSEIVGFSVFPHGFRHTWNDNFHRKTQKLIKEKKVKEGKVETSRSYFMGWKEGSGTAKLYTKRALEEDALLMQRQMQESDKAENEQESRGVKKEEIGRDL
ncbi:MAG: site-specific integrase [Pseudomonadales bacterium]|nr:site-specific integrase [Pseudomonadales bacterium]